MWDPECQMGLKHCSKDELQSSQLLYKSIGTSYRDKMNLCFNLLVTVTPCCTARNRAYLMENFRIFSLDIRTTSSQLFCQRWDSPPARPCLCFCTKSSPFT